MKIWCYDKITGALIPSNKHDGSFNYGRGIDESEYLFASPLYTDIKPPEYESLEIPVFLGTKWTVKIDYRNRKMWSKQTGKQIIIKEPGIAPTDWSEIEPIGIANPVFYNGEWREKTEKELYAERYAMDRDVTVETMRHECQLTLENKYFYKEIDFKGKHVRADQDSQKIITGYIAEINLGSRVYPLYWITCENDTVAITNNTEMISLVQSMSQWIEQSIFACRQAKDAIDDAETFDACWNAYIGFRDAEI